MRKSCTEFAPGSPCCHECQKYRRERDGLRRWPRRWHDPLYDCDVRADVSREELEAALAGKQPPRGSKS